MMMYRNTTARPSDGRAVPLAAALVAACVAAALLPAPAAAIQTLEAADHAELEAAVSATGVSRVALADDRIRRVIRSPGGFDVEHDAASGDLYLRPLEALDPGTEPRRGVADHAVPRHRAGLHLPPHPDPGRPVLGPGADPERRCGFRSGEPGTRGRSRDARVAELVRLVQAAARHEILPGYLVEAAPSRRGLRIIETWRGTRYVAHVLQAGRDIDAATLAERFGTGVAAVWVAAARDRVPQERTAVVVTEPARVGIAR